MPDAALQRRIDTLLGKLAERARACPGIAPVSTAAEFHALARETCGPGASTTALADALETLWRHPEEATTWANRVLLRSGLSTRPLSADAAQDWRRVLSAHLLGRDQPSPRAADRAATG